MSIYSIRRVQSNRRGNWSSSIEYKLLNMVKHEHQWWIASKDALKDTAFFIGQYWNLFGIREELGSKRDEGLTGVL